MICFRLGTYSLGTSPGSAGLECEQVGTSAERAHLPQNPVLRWRTYAEGERTLKRRGLRQHRSEESAFCRRQSRG
mgnify:CR=1 FL=1